MFNRVLDEDMDALGKILPEEFGQVKKLVFFLNPPSFSDSSIPFAKMQKDILEVTKQSFNSFFDGHDGWMDDDILMTVR